MSLEREKVFLNLKKNIENIIDQIEKGNPTEEHGAESNAVFLSSVENSTKLLAQSINNTALMYRSEPPPTEKESEGLCNTIESKAVQFLQAFLTVPMNSGRYFLSDVRLFCVSTLQSSVSFVDDLIKVNQMVRKKKRKTLVLPEKSLTAAAEVWEKGHKSFKELPVNNFIASSKFILTQLRLISDAISELDEAKELVSSEEVKTDIDDFEMDEFDLNWSETDLKILGPATGLLKTVKNLVKKIGQTAKEIGTQIQDNDDSTILQDKNNDLDQLCDVCAKLSPASDDLAATLYPPIDPTEVSTAAKLLIKISKQLLEENLLMSVLEKPVKCKIETANQEKRPNEVVQNWAQFLNNALKHNEDQLNLKLAERGIESLQVDK